MKEEMEIYPIDMQNGLYGYNDIIFKVCDQNNTPLDLTGVEIRVYVEDVDFNKNRLINIGNYNNG